MSSKKPLVMGTDGLPQQLQPGDTLDLSPVVPQTSPWRYRTADGATLYSSQPYSGSYGTLSIGATQSIRYMPFIVDPESVTITLLGIYVISAGAAGNKARLGIFNSNSSFRPSTRVVDAGEVAIDSTGQKNINSGISTVLTRGLYFLALANQIGFSMDSILAASYPDIFGTSTGNSNPTTYFVENRVYGTLPATAGTIINQVGNSPAVFFAFT